MSKHDTQYTSELKRNYCFHDNRSPASCAELPSHFQTPEYFTATPATRLFRNSDTPRRAKAIKHRGEVRFEVS